MDSPLSLRVSFHSILPAAVTLGTRRKNESGKENKSPDRIFFSILMGEIEVSKAIKRKNRREAVIMGQVGHTLFEPL